MGDTELELQKPANKKPGFFDRPFWDWLYASSIFEIPFRIIDLIEGRGNPFWRAFQISVDAQMTHDGTKAILDRHRERSAAKSASRSE